MSARRLKLRSPLLIAVVLFGCGESSSAVSAVSAAAQPAEVDPPPSSIATTSPPPSAPHAEPKKATRLVTHLINGEVVIEELPAESAEEAARDIASDVLARNASESGAAAANVVDGGDACNTSRELMEGMLRRVRKDSSSSAAFAIADESDQLMKRLGSSACRMDKRTRTARGELLALAGAVITEPARKREVLEESFGLTPSAKAAVLLGDLADDRNDLRAALDYYNEALALSPSSAVAAKKKNVEKKLAVEGNFVKQGNQHFSVSYEGSARQDLGDIALKHLEEARTRLRDKIGVEPASTIQVVLYVGEQYQRATSGPDWSGGLFDGKIRVREGAFKASSGALADTLTHEYVHALVRQSAKRGVPAWFNEGLAQYSEPNGGRLAVLSSLRGLTRESLPTLEKLSRGFGTLDRKTANVAYACALQLLEEMNAVRSDDALRRLFDDLEADKSFEDAFQSAYGITLARFEERWREGYPTAAR